MINLYIYLWENVGMEEREIYNSIYHIYQCEKLWEEYVESVQIRDGLYLQMLTSSNETYKQQHWSAERGTSIAHTQNRAGTYAKIC